MYLLLMTTSSVMTSFKMHWATCICVYNMPGLCCHHCCSVFCCNLTVMPASILL